MEGTVKILYNNKNADAIISAAGRISTTQGGADAIYEKSLANDKEVNDKLIKKILSSGHQSVLEHSYFNLSFNDVSVAAEQFMIEFRLAAFTVKSRRYVDFGKAGFYTPDFSYTGQGECLGKIYREHMEYLFSEYNRLVGLGVAKEDARFVLPYSFRSNFYCSVNARELIHIIDEMINGRGAYYPELKALGMSILEQAKKIMPYIPVKPEPTKKNDDSHEDLNGYISERQRIEEDYKGVKILSLTEKPCEKICLAFALNHRLNGIDTDNSERRREIIKKALSQTRKRELEQVSAMIRFGAVSLAGITHLARHRMQSLIAPEFVRACSFDKYVVPKSVTDIGERESYSEIFKRSAELDKKLSRANVRIQDRVYVLLSGMTVPVITTMNANELFVFIKLRTCSRAQWEIREYANELLSELRKLCPELFGYYGPSCFVLGKCPEGAMSCGKINEIREKYGADIKY